MNEVHLSCSWRWACQSYFPSLANSVAFSSLISLITVSELEENESEVWRRWDLRFLPYEQPPAAACPGRAASVPLPPACVALVLYGAGRGMIPGEVCNRRGKASSLLSFASLCWKFLGSPTIQGLKFSTFSNATPTLPVSIYQICVLKKQVVMVDSFSISSSLWRVGGPRWSRRVALTFRIVLIWHQICFIYRLERRHEIRFHNTEDRIKLKEKEN